MERCVMEGQASPSSVLISLGEVVTRVLPDPHGVRYYLYVPRQLDVTREPLVLVHGISRNAREHIEVFMRLSETAGRVIIAPLFSSKRYQRYQRVISGKQRPDQALLRVLEDVRALAGLPELRFALFGYSGGAQFAHRFAMMQPHRVLRLSLASAGWYTFPTVDESFPYGMGAGSRVGRRLQENLRAFLRIPMQVMVGEFDVLRDESLRQTSRVDAQQGRTRVERAMRWARAVCRAARSADIRANLEFELLPQSDHVFLACVERGGLVNHVARWLDEPRQLA